jgi:hypothetical protein
VKAGGKQGNRLVDVSDFIGNRLEMEDSKTVPVGSPVERTKPSVPIGCHTQPSEPIGDKNRITSMALKRAVCASPGKDRGEVVRVWWAENREVWERSLVSGC